jgi:cardiolipin synthase
MSEKYTLFDDNLKLFNKILEDMKNAKRSIWIEIFRFGKDAMGEKFRLMLYQKAKEGLSIKVLVDAWGTGGDLNFFSELIRLGVDVRIFRKMRFDRGFLAKNHCRNHRKLIIIDSQIAYMGSSNITTYCLSWRELNLRTTDHSLLTIFRLSFRDSFRNYNKYNIIMVGSYKTYHFNDWTFIQDYPDPYRQKIKEKYEHLISEAKEEVIVETPYFLPGHVLRKCLMDAAQRGVKVMVFVPYNSDVHVVDIIRRHYLGILYRSGVELKFYAAGNLHAKSLMIDKKIFSISSANFDYRSFRYQYEIALIGQEKEIINQMQEHFDYSLQLCRSFDYESWKNRSNIEKIIETILLPFRYLM